MGWPFIQCRQGISEISFWTLLFVPFSASQDQREMEVQMDEKFVGRSKLKQSINTLRSTGKSNVKRERVTLPRPRQRMSEWRFGPWRFSKHKKQIHKGKRRRVCGCAKEGYSACACYRVGFNVCGWSRLNSFINMNIRLSTMIMMSTTTFMLI